MKKFTKLISLLLALVMLCGLMAGCSAQDAQQVLDIVDEALQIIEDGADADEAAGSAVWEEPAPIEEDGQYTGRDEVALYIHTYGHLPSNFITKNEARQAGWEGGSLEPYFPGMSIGGDRFGNREGLLPEAEGRSWTECDVNTMGASSRGAERIVFSNDGLIYYTGDHYESFRLLYGESDN